jgi:hypothetical protein
MEKKRQQEREVRIFYAAYRYFYLCDKPFLRKSTKLDLELFKVGFIFI